MQILLDLLAGRGEIDLDRAALEVARIEDPALAVEPFLSILDSYAVELSERLGDAPSGADYVHAANQYLFAELGFKGNADDYYDPRNSCLNHVLTARTGIPITLAVLYMEIARRLAQPVQGIGLPGHFLVEYRGAGFAAYIDVFNGGRLLSADECFALARQSSGEMLPSDPRLLAPSNKPQIVTRMLRNLENVYMHRRNLGKTLQILDLLVAADPVEPEMHKRRGLLHYQMGNNAAAHADLGTYLRLSPAALDRDAVESRMKALRKIQARLN